MLTALQHSTPFRIPHSTFHSAFSIQHSAFSQSLEQPHCSQQLGAANSLRSPDLNQQRAMRRDVGGKSAVECAEVAMQPEVAHELTA